ncbi:MAG: hypothetical protein ACFB22_05485 [Rhodothalassiaceae bacterium]
MAAFDPHLALEHRRLDTLCQQLEAIADALPDAVPPRLCSDVTAAMHSLLCAPGRRTAALLGAKAYTLSGLKPFHLEEEALAQDLAEPVAQMASGSVPANPEMTGYMLRCLFSSLRRTVWIETLLQPQIRPLMRPRPGLTVVPDRG